MSAPEVLAFLQLEVPTFVAYLAGFQRIDQLSHGLDSLQMYRNNFHPYNEFASKDLNSDMEEVYTPLPSVEIALPAELRAAEDKTDSKIKALKERVDAIRGNIKLLHGGTPELGLVLPPYSVNGDARLLVIVREHWKRPARF